MTFTTIEIEYPNGRRRIFDSSDFDYYATTNELEHKNENITITLSSLSKSFIYETDNETGEILNKEYLTSINIQ